METSEITYTIYIGFIAFILLFGFVILLSFLFQKRRIQQIKEKLEIKSQFEKEIIQSQIEVQNQTLQNIGRELHDNIGQLLTVVKLNLGMVDASLEEKNIEEATENNQQIHQLMNQIITEVRGLSKSLDGNFVEEFGLQQSTAHELQRIKKSKKFDTELIIEGEVYKLDFQREIVVFRVVQEILNNAIKHSKAKKIEVTFNYQPTIFTLTITDDGIGFDLTQTLNQSEIDKSGVGLRSIQKRIRMLGGDCIISSQPQKGTIYSIKISKEQ